MQSDNLTISVLFGTGVKRPEIQKVLESLPQLKLLEQTCDPQELCSACTRGTGRTWYWWKWMGRITFPSGWRT